ncbi:MAG: TAT-variant-translocated molybdopterin oxidoreductase, partial [Verrucomicrobiota bacterium]
MKRKWNHPEAEVAAEVSDRVYWRSTEELDDTDEFREWLEREFPRGAAELAHQEDENGSRRNFMKYMGASTALAGLGMAGCRRPEGYLVPYNEHVEWNIPGKSVLYTSSFATPDGCTPLVVTTYDGRPTKVDGNRLHPDSTGGAGALIQASVLDLYDPDRSKHYLYNGERTTSQTFEAGFLGKLREGDGSKVALLLGAANSPTRDATLAKLKAKYPQLQVFAYEPLLSEAKAKAEEMLYGKGVSMVPYLDRAEKILTLDCDFIGTDNVGVNPGHQWARNRDPKKDMNRLYSVETMFTLTGGVADHRFRTPASQVLKVTAILASQIGEKTGNGALKQAADKLIAKFKPQIFNVDWLDEAAADLVASKGKALVLAGPRQPVAVHLLTGMINKALGADAPGNSPISLMNHGREGLPGLADLAAAISDGKVGTLISMTPADPLYDAPADLNLAELLGQLEHSVHIGTRIDATARASEWHVPMAHYLESWGDARSLTGTYSVVQPMILPLQGQISELDFLLSLMSPAETEESPSYLAVRETFDGLAMGDKGKAWNLTLRDGFHGLKYESAAAVGGGSLDAELDAAEIAEHPHPMALEVDLIPSLQLWDGRYVNNSWLQEVPDPMTKLTWDNAAVMSINTAKQLGISRDGELITLIVGERELEVPALRMPGQAEYTISLALGYGQEDVGRVGTGVGFDSYKLRSSEQPYIITGVEST